jgi:hypothetical protein
MIGTLSVLIDDGSSLSLMTYVLGQIYPSEQMLLFRFLQTTK